MATSLGMGLPVMVLENEGGSYSEWTTEKMPVLASSNIGAAKLLLRRRGFAFPHYADSTKIAFVLQGSGEGMAGLVSPDGQEERVVRLKKGGCFTVHKGDVSWWYNPGESLLEVLFIGETSDALVPGHIAYLFLSGSNGFLDSFSPEFLSKLYTISPQEAARIAASQPGMIFVKLEGDAEPQPSLPLQDCFNFSEVSPQLEVAGGGGSLKRFTSGEDDEVKVVGGLDGNNGMCMFEIKLKPGGALPPLYMARAATQVFYVVKGRAWVQIVSGSGTELDGHVDAGYLFVVPKFYMVAMVAGDEGVECLSLTTTSRPVFGQMGNVWSALSPGVLEAALNLSSEDVKGHSSNQIKKVLIINSPDQ